MICPKCGSKLISVNSSTGRVMCAFADCMHVFKTNIHQQRLDKVLSKFEKTNDPYIIRFKVSKSTDDVYIIYDYRFKAFMTRGQEFELDTIELITRDVEKNNQIFEGDGVI